MAQNSQATVPLDPLPPMPETDDISPLVKKQNRLSNRGASVKSINTMVDNSYIRILKKKKI